MKKGFAVAVLALIILTLTVGMVSALDNSFKAGSVTATGADITVSLGWTPKYVTVSNPTTTNPVFVEWTYDMDDNACTRTLKSSTAANIFTQVTTSCISVYSGSTTTAKGFTIGADTTLNISGDTLYYRAWR